nr:NAD(P)-binding domain-containing protein [Demequina litorisediminis]
MSLAGFVEALEAPRAIWVMVPAGTITQSVIDSLADVLEPGDTIIDGGNSITATTSLTRRHSRPRGSITSTAAPRAGSGDSTVASASWWAARRRL